MSMERPGPTGPKIEYGKERSREINEQESNLEQSLARLGGLLKEAHARGALDQNLLEPVRARYENVVAEVNAKFGDRLKSWPAMTGMNYAVIAATLGNPGGIEGLEIGATRFIEGGATAGGVALVLWSLARLKIWLQERSKDTQQH